MGAGMMAWLAVTLAMIGQATGSPLVLIVTGLGGEPAYRAAFVRQAGELIGSLRSRYDVPAERITWLAEDPAASPLGSGRATRDQVLATLGQMADQTPAGDPVFIVLLGHGSDQGEPRFNLPGPDLSASDLAPALDRFGTRPLAVVVAASASGGFADRLARPGRVIMTATRTGFERNESRFGGQFVRAFTGAAGDTDKDGALSLLEVFAFAEREVEREYESSNRLRTEHARLTDTTMARRFVFAPAGKQVTATPGDSVLTGLLARKRELEVRIETLRGTRGGMDSTLYQTALEDLVLQLARVNEAIRQRSGRTP